jgi:hypothetical protein
MQAVETNFTCRGATGLAEDHEFKGIKKSSFYSNPFFLCLLTVKDEHIF